MGNMCWYGLSIFGMEIITKCFKHMVSGINMMGIGAVTYIWNKSEVYRLDAIARTV